MDKQIGIVRSGWMWLERGSEEEEVGGPVCTRRRVILRGAEISPRGVLGTRMFTLAGIGGSRERTTAPRTQRAFYSLASPAMDVEIPPSSRRVAAGDKTPQSRPC